MIIKKKRKHNTAKWVAVLTFTILAAGCQQAAPAPEPSTGVNKGKAQNQNSYTQGNTPQKAYLKDLGKEGENTNIPDDIDNPEPGGSASTESTNKDKVVVAADGEVPQWNTKNPSLLGVAIGDSNAVMNKLFGAANDVYRIDDATDSIEVHEFKGFAIGLNEKDEIQYIEVYDAAISTGLGGIRVGDKGETAVKVLGKPSTQNNYIITYTGENTLLKIDLDTEKNQIVSIKLLAGVSLAPT